MRPRDNRELEVVDQREKLRLKMSPRTVDKESTTFVLGAPRRFQNISHGKTGQIVGQSLNVIRKNDGVMIASVRCGQMERESCEQIFRPAASGIAEGRLGQVDLRYVAILKIKPDFHYAFRLASVSSSRILASPEPASMPAPRILNLDLDAAA